MPDDVEQRARLDRFAAREERGRTTRAVGSDLRAAAGLVVSATDGVMGVVQQMQRAFSPPLIGDLADLVHTTVRGVTGVVGAGIDVALRALAPALGESAPRAEHEMVLAALNGVLGDRLAAAQSPLAIAMSLRPPLDERRQGTLLVLVHGSSMNDLQWTSGTHDHGRALMKDLERDVTLAYLHYNSGRHVKHNGEDFAALLEGAHEGFDEIVIVGHSMGGLVARSAVAEADAAGHEWRPKLRVLVTLGTPHHGSPLERAGNLLERVIGMTPWTAPLASLGEIRSAGVTDLRYGNVVDVDVDRFALAPDTRTHVELPADVRSYAVAATRTAAADGVGVEPAALLDDNLVPVPSALGQQRDASRGLRFTETRIVYGTDHLGLLASPEVYGLLRGWCGP